MLQLNTLLDGFIASWPTMFGPTILGFEYPLAEGSMAKLSWAQRLYEFPLGVFGIAVATAIFPALSRLASDDAAFAETLRRGVRLVLFIGLPASVGLMLVATPLAATILEGRAFTAEDSRETAWILLGYAPAVWAYSLNQVLVRGFYAKGDSMAPVRIAMGLVGLNLLLNLVLIWTPLRTAGLAWSTAICAALQSLWLMALAHAAAWRSRRGLAHPRRVGWCERVAQPCGRRGDGGGGRRTRRRAARGASAWGRLAGFARDPAHARRRRRRGRLRDGAGASHARTRVGDRAIRGGVTLSIRRRASPSPSGRGARRGDRACRARRDGVRPRGSP